MDKWRKSEITASIQVWTFSNHNNIDYSLSLLGIVPGTVLYVYLGAASSDLATAGTEGDNTLRTVFLIAGGLFGFLGVIWASKLARKELDKINATVGANKEEEEEGVNVNEAPC